MPLSRRGPTLTFRPSPVPAEHPSTYPVTEDTIPKHPSLHIAQLAKIITPETINVLPTKPAPPPHPVQHVANVVHNVVCPPQDNCSKCATATLHLYIAPH